MTQDIAVTFSAQDQGVIAYLQKQNAEVLKNQERLIKLGQEGKRAGKLTRDGADDASQAYGRLAGKLTSMAAGYLSVGRAIQFVTDANKRQIAAADDAAETLDTLQRRSRVQSGRTENQQAAANMQIQDAAIRNGVTLRQAFQAETQLVSSGFSESEARGGALDALLRTLAANNQTGKDVDPAALASAMSKYLESQGQQKTGANLLAAGQQVQSLFKGTNLQLTDFEALAKEGSALKTAGLDQKTQLGSFAALVDILPANEAATGLRNISGRLGTTGKSAIKTGALEEIGLTSKDVDLVGEDFLTAVDRLSTALKTVDESRQKEIRNILFEEQGAGVFAALSGLTPKIRQNIALQGDVGQFDKDVEIAQGGIAAARIRQEAITQIADSKVDGAGYGSLLLNEISLLERERGVNIYDRTINRGFAEIQRGFGVDAETAGRRSVGFTQGDLVDVAKQRLADRGVVDPQIEEQNRLMEEQIEVQKENNRLLKGNGGAAANAAKPPAKRPSSALAK